MPVWSNPAPQSDNRKCFQTWPNVPGARPAPADSTGLDPLPHNSLLLLHNLVATSLCQHGDCLDLLRATRTDGRPVSQGSPAPGYRSWPVRNWATRQEVSGGRAREAPSVSAASRSPAPAPPPQLRPTSSGIRVPQEHWVPGATKAADRCHKLVILDDDASTLYHCGNATVTILVLTS